MDHVILVDSEDREIGTMEKMQTHERGLLHRAFSVFVFDPAGRLLLQRRAFDKYHCGGLYTNTCCSHPRPGEETESAATRRLKEEMGFECELKWIFPMVYEAKFENGLVENEYDHVFLGRYEGPVLPDPDEVAEWQWIEPAALLRWMSEKPDEFTPWFKLAVKPALEAYATV